MATRQDLIQKATEDSAFRDKLKADPNAVVGEFFGQATPDTLHIQVLQETPTTMYVVLPADADAEMSEAMLAATSGGGSWIASTSCDFVTSSHSCRFTSS